MRHDWRDSVGDRHYHRALPAGAGSNGVRLACGEETRLAMNWSAFLFWFLLIGGLVCSIGGLILTFVRRSLRASE